MNRPDNILAYDEMDLKLGIKSSLPHVKSTLALAILLWECSDHPAELVYSVRNGDETVMTEQLEQWVIDYLADICEEEHITPDDLLAGLNQNQLFKSQMEALMVAFELVWKLAKVSFVDTTKAASAERTGGVRFPKKLTYSVNIDIIHSVISGNESEFLRVLLAWTGFDVNIDPECEKTLINLLTALSESAVFKLSDGDKDVIFNQNSIYRKLLETAEPVDVNGDKEAKGPLRILKSLLSEGMNPYLRYSNGTVTVADANGERIEDYQKRVDTLLRLYATKVIGLEDLDADTDGISFDDLEKSRISSGTNILLYGVPGSGKSWTIEHEYRKPGTIVRRLVFHPDYTYSDFIGQILPNVAENGQVSYKFTPGPFTTILHDAYWHPDKEYLLVIEEINRGNAPAIFGEIFQLLDRKIEIKDVFDDGFPIGTSEYGITNADIATVMYGKERAGDEVRIPSNLSIVGTMNTSDQNVFTLDTAFQRRWDMRLIENNFDNVDSTLANAEILDTGVTWKNFCIEINNIVVGNGVRMASSEDKRLGAYFVHLTDLKFEETMGDLSDGEYDGLRKKEAARTLNPQEQARLTEIREAMKQNRRFPEKVIKYLWDDAFKFNREVVFESTEYQSLEQIIRAFMYAKGFDRMKIFKDNVQSAFNGSTEE
jgi:hypothetical protein